MALEHGRYNTIVDEGRDVELPGEATQTFSSSSANGSTEPVAHPSVWHHFRDLHYIGGGGFGSVYRAWDTQLHRDVALKLLAPRGDAEEDQASALQEARMMARARHPNIVPVYGVAAEDGRVGFWSEFIEGPSLAAVVKTSGPLDARAAAAIVAELCKAVTALHAVGILHRDIKAENVLREPGGRVLLTDFGLSRDPGLRLFGGTVAYMAPELFAGQPASAASDIYALGVLLHFLVSGELPPPPLAELRSGLPKPFLDIVARATSAQPEARFTTAEGMLVALDAYLGSRSASSRSKRWRRESAIAVALLLLAFGAWFFFERHSPAAGTSPGAYALYQRAHALLQRRDKPGNMAAAASLFTQAIAADPKFALAHAELADTLWEQFRKTHDAALKIRATDEADRALELDRELPQAFLIEGRIHEGAGQRNLAVTDFHRALELDARNGDVYRELGKIYDAEGRDADADAAFQKAIDLEPDNWRNYNERGLWLLNKGRVDEAAPQFERELKTTPDNTWAINNLARARMRQHRTEDARRLLQQSIALAPDDASAHNSLGYLLMQSGEFDAATRQFQVGTQLAPGNYVSWANLAAATEFGAGGIEEARPAYRKAIELAEPLLAQNPSDAVLAASLGAYHAAVGDRERALILLRQAPVLAPDDANVLEAAGEGFEILGMRDKAIPLIMEALSRGYPAELVKRSPDLTRLVIDPRFRWLTPAAKKP
jgi:serine/threonine-protein kinase